MQNKPLIAVLIVVLLLIIGFLAFGISGDDATPQTATTTTTGVPVTDTTPPATNTPSAVTITYGADGFSPGSITVPAGTTVTWVNNGSGRMWVGSNDHPTHTNYDGSSTSEHCADGSATSGSVFDQCGAGTSYSFTFTKAGTWGYHNHANSAHRGTVTVTP